MMRWLLLLPGVSAFRALNSSQDAQTPAVFAPYATGFVGYYGDPTNPTAERVNEGSPYSPDTPRIFFSEPLKQSCPGMVGPAHNGEFYCRGRDYGYCDRRSGLCVCNQGYTGLDCTKCQPSYFKQGSLCFPKKNCPNDCSKGGVCDYATGVCSCDAMRRGADCSQRVCSFDELCVSCSSTACLRCFEGFYVDPSTQTCVSCARYDPRCLSCNASACLTCADVQLNSVKRSGPRRVDPALPSEELVREFSQTFVYGSQDPRVFDEAEPYTLVPAMSVSRPLNETSVACTQGGNDDAGWTCLPFAESHRVCGHRGVFSFVSPLYVIAEAAGSITITVQRSGGGLGRATLMYDLQHVTSTPGDVSPTMFYTSSQMLDFAPGVVSLAFKLQIHDDHVVDGNATFRLILRDPLAPSDLLAVGPATLGNQYRTLVTILDDENLRPVADASSVVSAATMLMTGGAAGDQLTFQIRSVLGSGVTGVDPSNEAVFIMYSYVEANAPTSSTAMHRSLQYGTVSTSGVDASLLTCKWQRSFAANYTVAVQLLYPGGLRGEYFGDAWLGESYESASAAAPAVSRIDRHVNFTWGGGPVFPGAHSHLSVRWSGWVKPLASGSTMFAVSMVGYARLWIGDVLVIDKWGGGEHSGNDPIVNAASAVDLDVSQNYALVLEYRTPRSGDLYMRLLWGSVGSTKLTVIPAQQLFSGNHIQGSPFANVTVTPASSASALLITSTLRSAVSSASPALVAVAGESFQFSITPRDVFGNRRRSNGQDGIHRDDIAASLTLVSDHSLGGSGTRSEDALVVWDSNSDVFRLVARTQRSGDYAMTVSINGNSLAGTPFTVVTVPAQPSVSRCLLSGSGLLAGRVAGQPVSVLLETRDLYANRIFTGGLDQLKLQASRLSSSLPIVESGVVVDKMDGTYTLTYTPRVVGSYSVAVTWKNVHLHNSPYSITVIPSTPVGPTSSAAGVGISVAQTNVQATFEVTTRDSSGNDVPSGGVAAQLSVVLEHAKGNVNGNACTDLLNGHYTCTYIARYVGATKLRVLLAGAPITGSPFLVDVSAGPALGSKCTAAGDALVSAVAGQRTNFTVSIYDAFGNAKTNAGNENVVAVFKGPGASSSTTANANVVVTYQGAGIFVVAYTLNAKGIYATSVAVDTVAIIASPFTIYVYPDVASPTTSSLDLVSPALPQSPTDPPVVFTAGAAIVTRLTTRDRLGNTLETGGNLFHLDEAVRAFLTVPIVDENSGTYLVTLRPTKSVLFPFTPKLMMPGGLNGSYYSADSVPVGPDTAAAAPPFSLLEFQRRDATINFDFADRPPRYSQSAETFSVRWEGFLLPKFSEIYTFELEVLGLASLQVGPAATAVTSGLSRASVNTTLTAQAFVKIELNFTKPEELPNAAVHLFWRSLSQPRQVIPSAQLFTSWRIVNNVPPLDIKPGAAAPSAFTAEFGAAVLPSSDVVRAVVDKPLVFIVVGRDIFGNRLTGEDYCTPYVKLPQVPQGSTQPDVTIVDQLDGSYKVTLVPHLTGLFTFQISALPDAQKASAPTAAAALITFLSAYNINGSPFKLQVDPGVPSTVMTTLVGGGFVTAISGKLTAFALELRDTSGNLLTNDMVTTYVKQVRVKLKSVSVGTEVAATATQVGAGDVDFLSAQLVRVEYTPVLSGLHAILLSVDSGVTFTQKTATLLIVPNVATARTSSVSANGVGGAATGAGLGPQIQVNQAQTYHVTVRDAQGNIRTSGGDYLAVRVRGPDNLVGTITDLNNGDYVVAYRVVIPGAYEIQTLVAEPERGLVGYYYVGTTSLQRNMPSAVRWIDSIISFDWSSNDTMRGYPRVVWKGFLRPTLTGIYTLSVQRDVGSAVGVYIEDQAVIDGLNADVTSGSIGLVGGRLHAITVEYHSASLQGAPGFLSLYWQSDKQSLEVIPTKALTAMVNEVLPRTQVVAV